MSWRSRHNNVIKYIGYWTQDGAQQPHCMSQTEGFYTRQVRRVWRKVNWKSPLYLMGGLIDNFISSISNKYHKTAFNFENVDVEDQDDWKDKYVQQ